MKFKREIVSYLEFYITKFTFDVSRPYLLFVHGGPGYHCGVVDYLIDFHLLFNSLNYNIILYDQRGCGRSHLSRDHKEMSHDDNVNDLQEISHFLKNTCKLDIIALMGHSYGAKVVYDLHKKNNIPNPAIFIATASSTLTPRINNLLLDLSYLKKTNPDKYNVILIKMNTIKDNFEKIWELTEELAPLFLVNTERPYHYWANLECYERVKLIQESIKLSINNNVFMSVRKDLYSAGSDYSIDIDRLTSPTLWVNGFHDKVMNGAEGVIRQDQKINVLFKSAHYPHIEENEEFCVLVNDFLDKWQG